jgi:hypothetical protein
MNRAARDFLSRHTSNRADFAQRKSSATRRMGRTDGNRYAPAGRMVEVFCRGTTPTCSSYANDRDKKLNPLGRVSVGPNV